MTTFCSSLFYARDLEGLKREGALSLQIILEECTARNVTPRKDKEKFALRYCEHCTLYG
jgi:predicted HicB family RNase H-like nuclease